METQVQAGVLALEQARRVVGEHAASARPGGKETLALLASAGRVLAETVIADRDFPPFPRATRDGYAVRAADVARVPVRLELIGEIKAGAAPEASRCTIGVGECVEIMTGAPVPLGADAVVMVEYTASHGGAIEISRTAGEGENIVAAASEARRGDVLLAPGARMTYAAIAVAASVGKTEVMAYQRPQVAILSTGDELVEIAAQPGPNQIRNSNTYSLAAQVFAAGGEPLALPIAPDETGELQRLIEQGLQSDLLLLTGGVSMGKYDLVEQVLHRLGAEFFFTGALIQPGRPTVFGQVQNKYFFGLPGNPVSTMVTFELFVRPVLDALGGAAPQPLRFLKAKLKSDIQVKTGLRRFLPGLLSGELERTEVELARWQGSGDIVAVARANCYIVVAPDRERIAAGEMVSVLMR